jgi:hypothetical protein
MRGGFAMPVQTENFVASENDGYHLETRPSEIYPRNLSDAEALPKQ